MGDTRRTSRTFLAALAATLLAALAPGAGSASASGPYVLYDTDGLSVKSGDAKAQASGAIRWYHGHFPYGYRHRGDYGRRAKVRAVKPVPCIWAKVTYGYPAGSLSIGPGGPGGTISSGEYTGNGYYVSCRRRGARRPRALGLYGVGYAKALLNSSTLEVCTSRSKRQGPRFCSFEKNTYGG